MRQNYISPRIEIAGVETVNDLLIGSIPNAWNASLPGLTDESSNGPGSDDFPIPPVWGNRTFNTLWNDEEGMHE